MSEALNALVAIAVIVLAVRWFSSGSKPSPASAALGFKSQPVTDAMVDTVAGMFPHLPRDNIRYDLLRTGSVETTTNKILERGFLDAPSPAYYTLYPRTPSANATTTAPSTTASSSSAPSKPPTLIAKLGLEARVNESAQIDAPEAAGAKAAWEETREKREASLRERKAQMVLAARQRLLAQQQKEASGSSAAAA